MREGWTYKNIEDISNVVNGYSFKSKDFSPENKIKSIKITNVGIMKFVEDSSNNLPTLFLKENAKVIVHEGDIVLALTRTIISGGLKVARVPKSYDSSLLNQRVAAIIPNSSLIDSSYLYYYFSSNIVYNYVLNNVNTLMQPNLSIGDLKKMEVPVCSIQEQKQIVALLDKTYTAIDQAKANIEKNIVNAKELFQSKLNAIFSQRGDGWEENSIDEISTVVNGYSFKSKDFSVDNEIKSIKITNVGIMEFVEDSSNNLPMSFLQEYSKVQVHEGDLVLALTRTIISGGLKVARVPESYHNSLLNQRVAAIVPNLSLVNSDYLYYYFSSDIVYNYVLSNVNTLMQPNLSIKDLKRMTIPITSLEGQRRISIQIEGLSEKTNLLISNYEVKLNNIEELKKSILQKAFSGELTQKEVVV
jgi:type I restriction enzyme S subunit